MFCDLLCISFFSIIKLSIVFHLEDVAFVKSLFVTIHEALLGTLHTLPGLHYSLGGLYCISDFQKASLRFFKTVFVTKVFIAGEFFFSTINRLKQSPLRVKLVTNDIRVRNSVFVLVNVIAVEKCFVFPRSVNKCLV